MAKLSDLQFNVGISISEETVQRCCQLLSIYLTDNPNKTIEVNEWNDYFDGENTKRKNVCITTKIEEENNG